MHGLNYALGALALVIALAPPAVWAVGHAKRRRGGAILLSGLLLMFGMNMQVTPPPPPQTEQVQRQAPDDEPKA